MNDPEALTQRFYEAHPAAPHEHEALLVEAFGAIRESVEQVRAELRSEKPAIAQTYIAVEMVTKAAIVQRAFKKSDIDRMMDRAIHHGIKCGALLVAKAGEVAERVGVQLNEKSVPEDVVTLATNYATKVHSELVMAEYSRMCKECHLLSAVAEGLAELDVVDLSHRVRPWACGIL